MSLLLRQFREDIVARNFDVFALRDVEFAMAEHLIERYAFEHPLLTLDAVQLAVAVGLRSQGLIDHFVSADSALCCFAALEGFSVLNPEHP